jgi:hypothetical protein
MPSNKSALPGNRSVEPVYGAVAVATSDVADLPLAPTRSIYVGVSGDVKVDLVSGDTVTFKAAPVGVLPLRVKRVYATGTTATNILALY